LQNIAINSLQNIQKKVEEFTLQPFFIAKHQSQSSIESYMKFNFIDICLLFFQAFVNGKRLQNDGNLLYK